jgi:hypothetical protein
MKSYYKAVGLAALCGLFGKSRQAYYEQLWHEEKALFEDAIIVDLVKEERRIARRVGGRNLYQILKAELNARQVHVGSAPLLRGAVGERPARKAPPSVGRSSPRRRIG